jgi:hypothetical protein
MAYLLAGIATPGDEADPRRLKELHFVGSVVIAKSASLESESKTPLIQSGAGWDRDIPVVSSGLS